MNSLRFITFTLFVISSSGVSALTISKMENTPSAIVWANVLNEVYKRAGIPVEFVDMPTERSLFQSSQGLIDGELVRIYTVGEKYPTLIRVPTPFTYFESRAYARSPDTQKGIDRYGWSALKNLRVGVVRGLKYAEIDLDGINDVVRIDRTEQLYRMLERGRIDVALSTDVSGFFLIRKLKLKSVYLLEPSLRRHDLYHYLHEKHKQYVPLLDRTIRAMKASGELPRLEEKFTDMIKRKIESGEEL